MEPAIRTFEVRHCLGRGGFGEVYRATMKTQGGLESDVAIKVLRRDLDPSGQAVERLRDEGKLLARLDHPVILRVHDLVVLEGRVALITEYIAGEDLAGLLGRRGPGPRGILEAIAKVAHALDAAWNAPLRDGTPLRLVHRDIKPSNIRVGKHGEVKLLDFGIARTDAVHREARTQTDMLVGSPAYMAPERFRTGANEPPSDVFSLGATLVEGLTGRRFYGRMELPRIAALALDRESFDDHIATMLDRLPSDLPDGVRQLVADTLSHEPDERITAAELADRAELLAEAVGGTSLARWCRGHSWRPESQERAEMSGRTVSEGSVAPPPPSLDPMDSFSSLDETSPEPFSAPPPASLPPQTRRGPGPWLIVGLVAIVVAAGGAGLAAAGGAGLAFQWYNAPGSVPADAPQDGVDGEDDPPELTPEPAPDSPEEPVAAPQPNPGPRPTPRSPARPSPEPAPAPVTPAPQPEAPEVAPEPVPEAAPEPAPVAPGRLEVSGEVPVIAIGPSGRIAAFPADLVPGPWLVRATFPGPREVDYGPYDVKSGETWQATCSTRMQSCTVTRQ